MADKAEKKQTKTKRAFTPEEIANKAVEAALLNPKVRAQLEGKLKPGTITKFRPGKHLIEGEELISVDLENVRHDEGTKVQPKED